MRKYQYLVLRLDTPPGRSYFVPRFLNGEEIKNWDRRDEPLHALLNELGNDGWELVTGYDDLDSLILKREK